MKKYLLSLLTLCGALTLQAQDASGVYEAEPTSSAAAEVDYNAPFRYGRYKNIGLAWSTLKPEYGINLKTKIGVNLEIGNTYMLPFGPLADMVKIGIDATWFDLTYINYKSTGAFKISEVIDDEYSDVVGDYVGDYVDDAVGDYIGDDGEVEIGNHQLMIGMGVGPSIHIAPFAHSSNALRYLTVSLNGKYRPTYSGLIQSDNDETTLRGAYVSVFSFGGQINWKQFGLGFEGRWGSAKYKDFVSSSEFEEDVEGGVSSSNKTKIKNSMCRLYLSFHF